MPLVVSLRTVAAAVLAVLLAFVAAPVTSQAQVGSSTDIITGRVTGPDGQPLAGARVEVLSIETQTRRGRTTGSDGRYTILFPDGGGQYHLTVRFLGMAPVQRTLAREADEDRFVVNVQMTANPTQLGPVVTTATRTPPRGERAEPGSTERVLNGDQLTRLPIDPTDPAALASMSPGVVSLTPSDSTGAAFSVAGQRPDLNSVTVDGANFDGGVPTEAVRQTRVITSTYDIARGQFTGGQISTTTRGGTNQVTGSFGYNLRDPNLQWREEEDGNVSQSFTQHSVSGGLGGPIVRDKLFWFGSAQLRRRIDPMQSLIGADPLALERLGTSPDSAARFRQLAEGYGVPANIAAIPSDRTANNLVGLARFDLQVTDDHSLMFRGDLRTSLTDAYRITPLSVPTHGGEQESAGGGAMLALSSVLPGAFLNELRLYGNRSHSSATPFLELPEGRVRVTSALPDGSTGVSMLEFGGSAALPQASRTSALELSDELSWISSSGAHRFKLGALLSANTFARSSGTNRLGSFTYNSLADLEANVPASFTRSLTPRERSGGTTEAAIYLGDTWRRGRALQLTYGVRLEGSAYRGRPLYNPAVEEVFGRRTDDFPREINLSPRVGFTWTVGTSQPARGQNGRGGGGFGGFGGGRGAGGRGAQQLAGANAPLIVRGGSGQFRGRSPSGLFSSAIDATGLPSGERQLVCIGGAVPTPDWSTWSADPARVPTECADGEVGSGPVVATQRPTVTVFDPGFGSPKSWRSSLGVSKRVHQRYNVSLDLSYALGTSLYGITDLNLDRTAKFVLPAEENRPVYVPASSIVTTTGATSVLASRRHEEFAHVFEVDSRFRSHSRQMTVSVGGLAPPSLFFNLAYTLSSARDQSSFSGGGSALGGFSSPTTAGDPTVREWARSDFDRRHSIVGSLTWPAKPWLDLTAIARASSGAPYTPRIGGDVNGDGARNDRAFIFDPDVTSDTAVANGMRRLLDVASPRARDCLESQMGRIASRNSCVGAWYPSFDMQANFRPNLGGAVGRRLTISVSTVNLLAGIDQLVHGAGELRGWGQPARNDATLLYVRGFDAVRQAYVYQVNERFGDSRMARTAYFAPFQLGVQARFQVGPDRQREMMQQMVRTLRDTSARRGGQGGPGGFNLRAMIERAVPNPAAAVLARRDSLVLTAEQVARLEVLRDSLQTRADSLVNAIATEAERSADPASLMNQLRPRLEQARGEYQGALRAVQGVLTPEQWEKVPARIKSPPAIGAGGGPGRQRAP